MDYNDYAFVHVNLKDWLYFFFSLISINYIELHYVNSHVSYFYLHLSFLELLMNNLNSIIHLPFSSVSLIKSCFLQ